MRYLYLICARIEQIWHDYNDSTFRFNLKYERNAFEQNSFAKNSKIKCFREIIDAQFFYSCSMSIIEPYTESFPRRGKDVRFPVVVT